LEKFTADKAPKDEKGTLRKVTLKIGVHVNASGATGANTPEGAKVPKGAQGFKGFKGLEAELTVLSLRLKKQAFWGLASDITVSVSFSAELSFESSTANRAMAEFAAKVKAAVSVDLKVPGTSFKIPVEISVFVNSEGKPGVGGSVALFKF
jgi:hypothetical protein